MWWRQALTIPHVVRLTRRSPRAAPAGWDWFWSSITTTGDGGDVLWDSDDTGEALRYRALLETHADPRLPVVDIGCGNGRFSRMLAGTFPRVVGVDVSAAAIARARFETGPTAGVSYLALDVTEAGAGERLRAELGGDANVFVRGVLHVLPAPARRAVASTVAALAGARGAVLIAETDYRGSRLGYLELLGAGPRGLPPALARIVRSGLPAPTPFGAAELEDCFPPDRWERRAVDAAATIVTVPSRSGRSRQVLPGFVAVLAPRSRA